VAGDAAQLDADPALWRRRAARSAATTGDRAGSGRRDRTKGAVICRRSVGSCTQDGQQNAGGDADDDVLDRATDRAAPRRVAWQRTCSTSHNHTNDVTVTWLLQTLRVRPLLFSCTARVSKQWTVTTSTYKMSTVNVKIMNAEHAFAVGISINCHKRCIKIPVWVWIVFLMHCSFWTTLFTIW